MADRFYAAGPEGLAESGSGGSAPEGGGLVGDIALQSISDSAVLREAGRRFDRGLLTPHQIVLLGESLAEDGTEIGSRRFTLSYGLVRSLTCHSDYDDDGPFGALHSDHIWDEIEVLEPGLFEHRMLFRDGVEVSIIFSEFSISYTDTLHSQAA